MSRERFCHRAHLDLDDSRVGRLGTCQQDSSSHIFRIEHIRLTDALLSSPAAECELGLDSAGANHANLDSLRAKLFIEPGTVCRVNRNVERTLVSIMSSYSSALVSRRFL